MLTITLGGWVLVHFASNANIVVCLSNWRVWSLMYQKINHLTLSFIATPNAVFVFCLCFPKVLFKLMRGYFWHECETSAQQNFRIKKKHSGMPQLWSYHLAELCVCVVSRRLIIKCNTYRQAQWWSHEIKRLSEASDFLQLHRFQSFAPPRANTLTKWQVLMRHCVLFCFFGTYFIYFAFFSFNGKG